jgi:orotate phosphoribosyltransferase
VETLSGRKFDANDLALLKGMADVGFVRHSDQPFRLKSGIMSHVYVYGREDLTDNPQLEYQVGSKISRLVSTEVGLNPVRRPCLIGVPTAGNALAQAAAMASVGNQFGADPGLWTPTICHRVMRELRKAHGPHSTWVNGTPDFARHQYWMVDNVATDGQSKLEAADKLEADGYPAKEMPCLIWIDRQQGAVSRLDKAGFQRVIVAFNLLDITYAYGELGLWPKTAVTAVEEEIRAHQFV